MSIDTIRFKLKNYDKYHDVGFNLMKNEKVTFSGMKFKRYNFQKESKEEEFTIAKLTSASYDINFYINLVEKDITFEFSIPKYLYGNNIEMFPNNGNDEYNELLIFLKSFFYSEFLCQLDYKDIEFERLDFCYNYSFSNQKNKEIYKHHLPEIFKENFKEHSCISYSENNTTMYKTQDYSFKIYDKGAEFLKHDYKKIMKYYGRNKADELLEKANKIMRSEITFRKRKISYEFFNELSLTQQVSQVFKARFKVLKNHYQNCVSLLDKIELRMNNFINDKYDLKTFDDSINELISTPTYKHYCNDSISTWVTIAKNIKNGKSIHIRSFQRDDFKNIVQKYWLGQMKEYNTIVAPKKIRLELSPMEKLYVKKFTPDLITLDDELFSRLFGKFRGLIFKLNNFSNARMTPLMCISNYENLLKQHGVSVTGLRKYVAHLKKYTNKQLVKEKIYTARRVQQLKAEILRVNEILQENGVKNSLHHHKIPEKITLNIAS